MRFLASVVLGLLVVLGLSAAGTAAFAVDDGRIGIQPSDEADFFHIGLAPGAAIERTAIITNYTDEEVTLRTYPVDGMTTPQGGFGFAAETDDRKNVGAWVDISVDEVVVPGKGQIELPFRLSVPDNATPGDYYGGLVIEAPPVAGDTVTVEGGVAVKLNIVQRQAVRIYLTVAGERHDRLDAAGLTWQRDGSDVDFFLTLRNTGNTILHPRATLALASSIGANAKLNFNVPESLLPEEDITLEATLKDAPPVQIGTATATVKTEAGTAERAADYTYVPWWLLVSIAAAIALLALIAHRVTRFVRRARRAIALTESRSPAKDE